MAGKAKAMSQIKQLLRLHKQGNSINSMARNLGISKNTVKSYLIKLAGGTLPLVELLELEDPVLESKFHAGNPAYKDPRFEHLTSSLVQNRTKDSWYDQEAVVGRVHTGLSKRIQLFSVLLSFAAATSCPQTWYEAGTPSCG